MVGVRCSGWHRTPAHVRARVLRGGDVRARTRRPAVSESYARAVSTTTLPGGRQAATGGSPRARRRSAYAVGGWLLLVGASVAVGAVLHQLGLLRLGAFPPFQGELRAAPLTWQLLPAAVFAGAAIVAAPRLARTTGWGRLLLLSWLGAAGWACVLAASDGPAALATPLLHENEYLGVAAAVGDDPLGWLREFAGNVGSYPTHVAGHPPLPVLMFWLPHAVGLPLAPSAAALCILLGSSASAAVLVTARHLVGEERARAAAPYLLLAPYALTVATSADAMFLGVTAWGIALLTIASVRDSALIGLAAGVLLGATAYLNYGLLPVGAIAIAVVVLRPSARAVTGALAGAALVAGAFTAGGFWWPDGVAATHERWAAGSGSRRPYGYVLVANVALLAVITGPATAAGLVASRGRRLWLLLGAVVLAVVVLDLSGVTRGEVERIWLPFAPWLMLAAAALPSGHVRRWLAVQVATALLVQGAVKLLW